MKIKICILRSEWPDAHHEWIAACEKSEAEISFDVVDITRHDWMEKILAKNYDLFLVRTSDRISYFKTLCDERLYIINKVLGKHIYPSYEEILVYENKKFLSYWLKANNIPHPVTHVFYNKVETLLFARDCQLPVVGKTSIGASGSGIKIIKTRQELDSYIKQVFSDKGITRRWGVNFRKGDYKKRLFSRIKNIPGFLSYLNRKRKSATIDPHRWFVIFQEFLPVTFEWRAVRIGDSFFAHKKLGEQGGLISGTSKVSWDGPSRALLDFVESVTDKRRFLSQAVDIFETEEGKFLVNELQCFFGSKSPYQMILDGKPGRYVKISGNWVFEEGNFNENNSYNLRLEHALEILNKK